MQGWQWEVKLPINQENVNMFHLHEKSGVYAFWNGDGALLYIGKSVNINKRLREHFAAKQRPVNEIRYFGYTLIAEKDLNKYEKYLISLFRPEWNKYNKPKGDGSGLFEIDGFKGVLEGYSAGEIRSIFLEYKGEKIAPVLESCSIGFAAEVLGVSGEEVMEKVEAGRLFAHNLKRFPEPRISANSLLIELKRMNANGQQEGTD